MIIYNDNVMIIFIISIITRIMPSFRVQKLHFKSDQPPVVERARGERGRHIAKYLKKRKKNILW